MSATRAAQRQFHPYNTGMKQNPKTAALRKCRVTCLAVAGGLLLAGCDKPQTSSNPPKTAIPAAASVALPADLFVSSEPADVKSVIDAKKAAKEGDEVVIRGRIGGSEDPFVPERAIFTIVDKSLPHCGEMKMDDGCKTPWDYCCEPKDKLVDHSATVQIVDASGKPLKLEISKTPQLKPMSEIVVKGKLSKKDGDKVFVVNAGQIFVKS